MTKSTRAGRLGQGGSISRFGPVGAAGQGRTRVRLPAGCFHLFTGTCRIGLSRSLEAVVGQGVAALRTHSGWAEPGMSRFQVPRFFGAAPGSAALAIKECNDLAGQGDAGLGEGVIALQGQPIDLVASVFVIGCYE